MAYDILEPVKNAGEGYEILEPETPEATTSPEVPQPASRPLIKPASAAISKLPGGGTVNPTPPAQDINQPYIPLPKFEIKQDDSIPVSAGKEAANLLIGIPEFLETPLGTITAPVGGVFPKTVAAIFSADMLKNLGQQIVSNYKNWSGLTTSQKTAAIVDMIGTGALSGILGRTALKGHKPTVKPETTEAQNAEAIRGNQGQLSTQGGAARTGETVGRHDVESVAPRQPESLEPGKEAPQEVKPPSLTPVLEIAGKPVAGESHAAIRDAELAKAKTDEERDAVNLAFIDESKHKFQDQNGNILSRDEAKPVLEQITGKPVTKPVESSDIPVQNKRVSKELVLWGRKQGGNWVKLTDNTSNAEMVRREKDGWEVIRYPKGESPEINKEPVVTPAPTEQPQSPTGGELETGAASTTPPVIEKISTTKGKGQVVDVTDKVLMPESGKQYVFSNGQRFVWIGRAGKFDQYHVERIRRIENGILQPEEKIYGRDIFETKQEPYLSGKSQGELVQEWSNLREQLKTWQGQKGAAASRIRAEIKQKMGLIEKEQELLSKSKMGSISGLGSPSKAQGPEQTLGLSGQVKVTVPEGATQIRVTDKSGKVSVQPLSNVNKGDNPFQGVEVKKIEAGIIGKDKKFQPVKGPISVGPGAQTIGEPAKPQIAQLTDSIRGMAQSSPRTDSVTKVFDLGRVASEAKDRVSEGISGLKAAGEYLKTKLQGYPVWNSWKAALGDRHLALTESVANAKAFVKESERAIPDATTQAAISKWIDMGGNDELLAKGEAETKPQYKAGYAAARNLTPEQLTVANNAKNYFDSRLQDAIDNGILEDGIEDYIHRYYQKDSPFKQSILNELRSGIFTGRPAFAKQRVNQFDLDAEKAGLKPVQSFIKRIAAYDLSLNKAIADRQAVKAMTQIIMPDGRPLADVAGIGVKVEGEGKGATLIKPSVKKSDAENPVNNRADYKSRDYPALRKWKWVSQDANGNPILVQGDVVIHPDGLKLVDPLFRRSAVRQNPVGRLALGLSSTIKQTMLDLSGFHPVQITVHGWEHRTFKPVEKIDFDNPDVRGLIRGGLVAGETTGHELFSEGLTGSSLTRHIPVIGDKLQAYNHWLFNDYIPRLKVATGLHALERNRSRFKNLSNDELYHLTANQMNNAFGELNYDMIGRSKTTQDVMRLALLAPDFLEARAGFAGQALTKYGREQFAALALGAVTLYVTSRIINKLLTGEYHFEPKNAFSVVYNKRAYSLRTVQGDILHAINEPGKFIYNRLNPTFGRTLMEFFSKRDVFGRQRSGLQQLKDFAKTIVPISLRGLINPREQTLWESFLNAIGITERRSTQQSTVYQLAENFRKANNIQTEPGEFIYDPDKDPYRSIKEAAVFSTVEQTAKEINKAVKAGHSKSDIWKHFVSYSQRPFTGSRKNDALFYEQLSDDNKKIYDDALNERKQAVEKFRAAWELATEETPSELPTTQGFEARPKFNVFSE